jgi:hypothetical protein
LLSVTTAWHLAAMKTTLLFFLSILLFAVQVYTEDPSTEAIKNSSSANDLTPEEMKDQQLKLEELLRKIKEIVGEDGLGEGEETFEEDYGDQKAGEAKQDNVEEKEDL